MSKEWKEVVLENISKLSYGKMPKKEYLGTGEYPTFSGYKYQYKYPVKNVNKGDVIVVARGVGGTGDVKLVKEDSYLTNLSIKFEFDNSIISNKYFYYFFQKNNLKYLDSGSAQSQITIGDLNKVCINLPPLAEQKAIAKILGDLDAKIELNRKMNQTLENMAQALFQSWFVDFDPVLDNALAAGNPIPEPLQAKAEIRKKIRLSSGVETPKKLQKLFPSTFVFNDTLEKWIPEGWEVKSLAELVNLIGGGTPKTSVEEYWNGDVLWFSVVDAPRDSDVFVIDTEKKITPLGVEKSSTKILRKGITIISARGTVGKCAIVGVPTAMNQSCYGVESKTDNQDYFINLLLRKMVSDLQGKSHGSVFSTITKDTFKAIQVVVPDLLIINDEFERLISHSFEKIKSNLFHSQALIQQRDVLLPQLVSGKVKAPQSLVEQMEKELEK
ncbi:restriction endonuclease subunit S [Wenyingzhuangia aestuarii]|uniref:restriction endonuclease subunit S n=1 Tax=Wenyingzhuangia aestuarii TaxID=1647582 RepID=UPI00143C72D0|nr:restriction endonuclease subunit S [Wenyingzhuangia aestuarii]NJB83137.1 type I restriction enzyme S subunit [Wenyingzhuangia aestuarii]